MIIPNIVSELPITNPDGLLSIDFVASYDGYVFKDAIVGSPEYIQSLSAEKIQTIKVNRFNVWYKLVTASEGEE
jgi:hypothetical protein